MSTILLYEQDEQLRGLFTEWLERDGYELHAGTTWNLALRAKPDLVVASVYMPKQAGTRLIDEIRVQYPGVPVIAISAQFRADLSSAGATAHGLGVAQVIAKPLTRDALLDAVKSHIRPSD
jgi:DNA-binding response OmpR family regulator